MTLESFIDQLEDASLRNDRYGVKPHSIHQHDPQERLQYIAASVGNYFRHPPLDIESDQVSFQMTDDATYAWVTGVRNTEFGREWGRFLKTLNALAPDGVEVTHRLDLMWAEKDYDRTDPSPVSGDFEGRANQHLSASIETDDLTLTITFYLDGTLEMQGGYAMRSVTGYQAEMHYQICLDATWEPTDKPQAYVTRDTLREHSYYAAQVRGQYLWNQKQEQLERARQARRARSAQSTDADETAGERDDREVEPIHINEDDIVWADEHENTISDERAAETMVALEARGQEDDDQETEDEDVEEDRPRAQSEASETPLHDML